MDIQTVLKELGEIQRLKNELQKLLEIWKTPLVMDLLPCPACRTKQSFSSLAAITIRVPEIKATSPSDPPLVETQTKRFVHETPLFRLIDGRCRKCEFDIWPMLCRLEPEVQRDIDLSGIQPRPLYGQRCDACGHSSVRGFWRAYECTGGSCLDCGSLMGPHPLPAEHMRTYHRLEEARWMLDNREYIFLRIAESYDDIPTWMEQEDDENL